jgi:hypothetical protein
VAAADDNYIVLLCHEGFARVPRGKNQCGKSRSILQAGVESHKAEARERLTWGQERGEESGVKPLRITAAGMRVGGSPCERREARTIITRRYFGELAG